MEHTIENAIQLKMRFNSIYSVFPFIWFSRLFLETLSRAVRFKNRANIIVSLFLSEWIEYITLIVLLLFVVHTIDKLNSAEVVEQQNYLIQIHSSFNCLPIDPDTELITSCQQPFTARPSNSCLPFTVEAIESVCDASIKMRKRSSDSKSNVRTLPHSIGELTETNQLDKCSETDKEQCKQIIHQIAIRVQFEQSQEANPTVWHMFHINQGLVFHFLGLLVPFTIMCIPFLPIVWSDNRP